MIVRHPPLLKASSETVAVCDLTCAAAVGDELLRALGVPGLRYLEPPVPVAGGWDAHIFRLQFMPGPDLPKGLSGPLILRAYGSQGGQPRARTEFLFQRRLWRLGFPVAQPLLLARRAGGFGGPFLVMRRVPGRPLFHAMLSRPWQVCYVPARVAHLHVRLHELPVGNFLPSPTPFLTRRLNELRALADDHALPGLKSGIGWLEDHRPTEAAPRCFLHLDWHPLNLMESADGSLHVLDWTEADVGDYHADVAMALVMLETAPNQGTGLWAGIAVPVGRWITTWEYRCIYSRHRPLDPYRLSYYQAWAALRRLAFYGRWLHAGPESTGSKPGIGRLLQPGYFASLARCFHRHTGVHVTLGSTGERGRETWSVEPL